MRIQWQRLIKNYSYVPSFVRPLYMMIANQNTRELKPRDDDAENNA